MNGDRSLSGLVLLGLWVCFISFSIDPMFALSRRGAEYHQKASAVDLDLLLAKAAEYCRKLESAILDFICREEISERIDPALDVPSPQSVKTRIPDDIFFESRGAISAGTAPPMIDRSFVYDYQCMLKEGRFQEVRTLLEENGKKKNEPKAKLKTSVILYENAFLGPYGIFNEEYQAEYRYIIIGSEKFEKKPVIIIDAKPKLDAPEAQTLYGKAWVDPVTGNIVKIEYSESRIGHYEVFAARGEKYGLKPRVTMRAEFSVEKNGLRFPTKLFIEEAYLNASGRTFVRSETSVVYKDFKFFTVEVAVR